MQLNETLQVCLLALASRYPQHTVDVNEDIVGMLPFDTKGWHALDLIEELRDANPGLLDVSMLLVINLQKCEIYFVEQSLDIPALVIHCRGKLPTSPLIDAAQQREIAFV